MHLRPVHDYLLFFPTAGFQERERACSLAATTALIPLLSFFPLIRNPKAKLCICYTNHPHKKPGKRRYFLRAFCFAGEKKKKRRRIPRKRYVFFCAAALGAFRGRRCQPPGSRVQGREMRRLHSDHVLGLELLRIFLFSEGVTSFFYLDFLSEEKSERRPRSMLLCFSFWAGTDDTLIDFLFLHVFFSVLFF